jgi:hypothetical protein
MQGSRNDHAFSAFIVSYKVMYVPYVKMAYFFRP